MSLQPRIRRVLVPPAAIPNPLGLTPTQRLDAVTHLATHRAKESTPAGAAAGGTVGASSTTTPQQTNNNSSNVTPSSTSSKPFSAATTPTPSGTFLFRHRHLTLHPVQPLLAYVLEDVSSSSTTTTNNNNNNKILVVQNWHTQEIVWSLHWLDLAATVVANHSPEEDAKRLAATAQSILGTTVVSLHFYDPSVLFWSRLLSQHPPHHHGPQQPQQTQYLWQSLVVQTDKRILVLNLRRNGSACQTVFSTGGSTAMEGSSSVSPLSPLLIQATISEKTVGAAPSSNALPVGGGRWLLVGCADGSLKCFDWTVGSVFKKIKGLGKGDCVTQLLAAHPYRDSTTNTNGTVLVAAAAADHASSSAAAAVGLVVRRVLAVTKKGLVYLMEVTMDAAGSTMDLQSPLARFQVPHTDSASSSSSSMEHNNTNSSASSSNANTAMEHTTFSYDAHTDRFLWLVSPKTAKDAPILYVWNLKTIVSSLSTNASSSSKSLLLKPEPTLIVQFPAVSSTTASHGDATLGGGGGGGGGTGGLNTPSKDTDAKESSTLAVLSSTSAASQTAVTVVSGLVHPAFAEQTVVSVTLTASGDLCLHGAEALASNTTSTVSATPCMAVHLKQAILAAISSVHGDDALPANVESADLKVYSATTCPLQATGMGTILTVASNWGIVVLELPMYSNASVQCRSVASASRHLHFSAGLGSLGKSVLVAQNSTVVYGSLDVLTPNPAGWLEPRNTVPLYDSPPAHHMPAEFYKRPFRCAPLFLQSPSGVYICLFWPCEFRYEVLHTATLFLQVGQSRAVGGATQRRNPVVATGVGVCDFGWVSDDDVFAILHAPDLQEQAALQVPKQSGESESYNLMSPNLKMIGAGAMGVANLATTVTKTATNATLSATKLATSAVNTTMTVTKGATTAANMTVGVTSKAIRSGAKGVTKGVKKSFGIFGKKKKNDEESIVTAADDDDEDDTSNATNKAAVLAMQRGASAVDMESLRTSNAASDSRGEKRHVELKRLEAVESQAVELSGGIPAATCVSIGKLSLRGGNRNLPTAIYGGPALCVSSQSEDGKEGHAHFYINRTTGDDTDKAKAYQSSGPTLPYPDNVVWDDDGRLCAVVVENRIAIYSSDEPIFQLLGSVYIGSPLVSTADVSSLKFIHGTLFCCTWNSVHCVLLGDLEIGICKLDIYLLASTDVDTTQESSDSASLSWAPIQLPSPLVQPSVLGFQGGSLMISTLRGIQAVPLHSPLIRIGLLLAAGQTERAIKWFDAVANSDHEALAAFLERRGYSEMAVELPGISLETIVDLSMRFGFVDRLEDTVETYGVAGLRTIDLGRGVVPSIFGPDGSDHQSVVVCVGAYLLAHGRVERVRRLATECLRSGQDGKKDALLLASLLLPLDEADAMRLIQRAVGVDSGTELDKWTMGEYVRNFVLAPGSSSSQTS